MPAIVKGSTMLNDAQIAQYHEDGYVVPDFRLDPSTVEAIADLHARLLVQHPEFADYCPALLAYELGFLNYARDAQILEMVGQLIGDDFALWNCSFFAKPAGIGKRVPWHQDGEYWPIRPLATCSVWLAIDPSTRENGCLEVIPGSHKRAALLDHEHNASKELALPLELKEGEYDPASAVAIELEPGQISLHDVFLCHGSEPNRSAGPRRGMTMRFMPTSSVYDRSLPHHRQGESRLHMSNRTLYLMRGKDLSGRNDFAMHY